MISAGRELYELGLAAAARAIRNGEASSEAYVTALLARARAQADLNAFIAIKEAAAAEKREHPELSERIEARGPDTTWVFNREQSGLRPVVTGGSTVWLVTIAPPA